MNEKPSLRRFSEHRRLVRLAGAVKPATPKSARAASPQRVTFSVRTTLLPGTAKRLDASCDIFDLSRSRLVGNVLEWFAVQPELIQAVVAGKYSQQRTVEFSALVLRQLLAR